MRGGEQARRGRRGTSSPSPSRALTGCLSQRAAPAASAPGRCPPLGFPRWAPRGLLRRRLVGSVIPVEAMSRLGPRGVWASASRRGAGGVSGPGLSGARGPCPRRGGGCPPAAGGAPRHLPATPLPPPHPRPRSRMSPRWTTHSRHDPP